jgi:hypothetical protein
MGEADYDLDRWVNGRIVKAQDGFDYLIVSVSGAGLVRRGGRQRFMRLGLMRYDEAQV